MPTVKDNAQTATPLPTEAMTDAQIEQWIDACNHEPAREVLRDYIKLRASLPRSDTGRLREALKVALTDVAGLRNALPTPSDANPICERIEAALTASPSTGEDNNG